MLVQRHVVADDVPEPAPGDGQGNAGAGVQLVRETAENSVASALGLQFLTVYALCVFALFGKDDFSRVCPGILPEQDAALIVFEQQNAGEHKGGDTVEIFAAHYARVESVAFGRTQAGRGRI